MQKGRNFSELINYFDALARNHVAIRHSATNKHYYRLELEELLSGLNNACYPALNLEGYSLSLGDSKSDNPVKYRTAAFVLIDQLADPGDFDGINAIWDKLEHIGDDIIARIRADKNKPNNPVRALDLDTVEATLIRFDATRYGIRYMFQMQSFFPSDVDTARWIDLADNE
ncbi:MAG: hypothetical protein AB7C90_05100 [Bacteroidales bacterium]